MTSSPILLATLLLLGPVSCVEQQIEQPNTTKRTQTDGGGTTWASGTAAVSQNGGGTSTIPAATSLPNYGAPSVLGTMVDALPMPAARGGGAVANNQPFFENGRFTGGGLLASVGNLLFEVFGVGQKR